MRLRDGARAWYNGGMRIPLFLMATCAALSAPAVRWSPTGGGSNAVHEGKSCYQCPLYGCANPLRADVGTVHYPPMIQVVEPKGVRSRVIEYIDYPDVVHKGEAGPRDTDND